MSLQPLNCPFPVRVTKKLLNREIRRAVIILSDSSLRSPRIIHFTQEKPHGSGTRRSDACLSSTHQVPTCLCSQKTTKVSIDRTLQERGPPAQSTS
jgi:hypothetical protein